MIIGRFFWNSSWRRSNIWFSVYPTQLHTLGFLNHQTRFLNFKFGFFSAFTYDQDPQFAQTAFLARIFEFLEVACLLSTFFEHISDFETSQQNFSLKKPTFWNLIFCKNILSLLGDRLTPIVVVVTSTLVVIP
jgi:hypothetical protein